MTLESKRLGSGNDNGDLTAVEWRRRWRLSDQAVKTTLEAQRVGIGDDIGDLALKLLYFTLNSKK